VDPVSIGRYARISSWREEVVANPADEDLGNAKDHLPAITEEETRMALTTLDPMWDELFPAEQTCIVQMLVERVDLGTDGFDVQLRLDGMAIFAQEMR
jgi:hypothetical protein